MKATSTRPPPATSSSVSLELFGLVQVGAVERENLERRAGEREAVRGVVGVHESQAGPRPGRDVERSTPSLASSVGMPSNVCAMSTRSRSASERGGRLDDDRAEEPAPNLLRGRLVRVVPERADLLRAEAVHVALAGQDGILGHACDPVLGVRHVDAVPVDRHALLDVLVDQRHLDEVALAHAQLRSGRPAVEGQRVDWSARGELDRRSAAP